MSRKLNHTQIMPLFSLAAYYYFMIVPFPISISEVWEAVNEMEAGKVPALDGFPVKCE